MVPKIILCIIAIALVACHSKKKCVNEDLTETSSVAVLVDSGKTVANTNWLQDFEGHIKDFDFTFYAIPNIPNNSDSCHFLSSLSQSAPQVTLAGHLKGADLVIKKKDSANQNVTTEKEITNIQKNDSTGHLKNNEQSQNTVLFKPPNISLVLICLVILIIVLFIIKRKIKK